MLETSTPTKFGSDRYSRGWVDYFVSVRKCSFPGSARCVILWNNAQETVQ